MLDKNKLKGDIRSLLLLMMQREESSVDEFATRLSDAIDGYVKTATVIATPASIAEAGMSNTGGPVVAAKNLTSTLL